MYSNPPVGEGYCNSLSLVTRARNVQQPPLRGGLKYSTPFHDIMDKWTMAGGVIGATVLAFLQRPSARAGAQAPWRQGGVGMPFSLPLACTCPDFVGACY